jgi:hypothetical protein
MHFYSTLLIKPTNKHYWGVTLCLQLTYKDVNGRQLEVCPKYNIFVGLIIIEI